MSPPRTLNNEEWPPNYVEVLEWRQKQLIHLRSNPHLWVGAKRFYAQDYEAFINHWGMTYDPRNAGSDRPTKIPFILFKRQADMIQFLVKLKQAQTDGLFEKARDFGATWLAVYYSVCEWLFEPGASIGWGSRKESLVDKVGDLDSIFEKIRFVLRNLPVEFLPEGFKERDHATYMKIINPATGATITGEAGDNIGRGGRKSCYFKDESAHYERPEMIEASLGDNTRMQVDISSVNGTGNVFHRRRLSGEVWEGGEVTPKRVNVMLLDWRDHPAKTQEWYDARRKRAEEEGLLHLFAQEVDRDYASAVAGVLIPKHLVDASIDAHIRLGWPDPSGHYFAGLDVADDSKNGDKNAYAERVGYLFTNLEQWSGIDTTKTTNKALRLAERNVAIQYDCIGVGAGVKGESNRIEESNRLPPGVTFTPWSASDAVQGKDEHLLKNADGTPDKKSPLKGNYYQNLRAQAAWEFRLRFERTYKAVHDGADYNPETMIAIPSTLPHLTQFKDQLSQPVMTRSVATGKMLVDKAPPGTKSPNLFDAAVMAFFPLRLRVPTPAMFLRAS
jgi:phage terminase large subunit